MRLVVASILESLGGLGGLDFSLRSYLMLAVATFVILMVIQVVWSFVQSRRNAGGQEHVGGEDEMVACPECGEPTERMYRFCRNCASDTGKRYASRFGSDGSNENQLF